ncbi:hypothetical protein ASPBRDRAFT_393588 [Aspergillus brasiliensis CBS 101740]|uniref:Maltose/galactoside acetyltransferase domain-containing protein n=1 Tax=Aspergillus brasiliensis (strain CBS 101740 / IMI 381727 / IBT 21946) TaxID=767769 RepID=A0A1L9UWT4_ASPBC|nr:hypothetical protein ASPBRDRAFT_393588 [Aspergillus brasiliensis CBS 101740]
MTTLNEWQKMLNGELYNAWDADPQAHQQRCKEACDRLNQACQVSRHRKVELWRKRDLLPVFGNVHQISILGDTLSLPPVHPYPLEDEKLVLEIPTHFSESRLEL